MKIIEKKDVKKVIDAWDPINLLLFSPKDEYESEVLEIFKSIGNTTDKYTLASVFGGKQKAVANVENAAKLVKTEISTETAAQIFESEAFKALESVIKPNGKFIGEPGENHGVRILKGTADDAKKFFAQLAESCGGKIKPHPNPKYSGGLIMELPNRRSIAFRPDSLSGPASVDIQLPELFGSLRKIKFK